jgi:hypothetical protein
MKRNDLVGLGGHGDPELWLVRFLVQETPHLASFGFQLLNEHVCWTD